MGMSSVSPGRMTARSVRLLASSKACNDMPNSLAMEAGVSPGLTLYVRVGGMGVGVAVGVAVGVIVGVGVGVGSS